MIEEENEDEITSVHTGEPLLPPTAVGPVRPGPLVSARRVPEETVLLSTAAPEPGSSQTQTQALRPADSGWGTVVLPGGGHPDHVVDRTQLLALDEPDAAVSATARLSLGAPEPVEAVDTGGLTSIRPPAGLEPFPGLSAPVRGPSPEAWAIPRVGLASAPASRPAGSSGAGSAGGRVASSPAGGLAVPATASASDPAAVPVGSSTDARSTAPPTDGPGTVPAGLSKQRITAPPNDGSSTMPVAVGERRTTAPPTSGSPAVPASHPAVISGGPPVVGATSSAGHPVPGPGSHPAVISGASPVVGVPPSGGHPMVISGGHPAVGATTTGGQPVLARSALRGRGRAPAPSADTRLAWGFLLGVLITVAIVGVAVALGLYLVRS